MQKKRSGCNATYNRLTKEELERFSAFLKYLKPVFHQGDLYVFEIK